MIKKISELTEATEVKDTDIMCMVDLGNGETKKIAFKNLLSGIIPRNAGAHNAIYRGKDITDLFYDGTLSKQIAAGTFDDIYIGDYIIGKVSKRKYLVADLDYRYGMGDTEITKHHVLMIPDRIMYTARMNATNTTAEAYIGSEMYKTNLASAKSTIQNDFESSHILAHRNRFTNAVKDNYESGGVWTDSTVDLMNEMMVYGSNAYHNCMNGTVIPDSYTTDNRQLSLFKLDHSKIIARNDAGDRFWYWLRDVASASWFCGVNGSGLCTYSNASGVNGVRPAFLIV